MIVSLDSETCGLDLRHGALPYFITSTDEDGNLIFWDWQVDPLTRVPDMPSYEVSEVVEYLRDKEIVLHNGKFDLTAFAQIDPRFEEIWGDWSNIHDTLTAAHVLGSSKRKDLTSLAVEWLHTDIEFHEIELKTACEKARSMVRLQPDNFPEWRLAKHGDPKMPSIKKSAKKGAIEEKPWKNDTWLPAAVARRLGYQEDHPWFHIARDYANCDSETTILLWKVMREELISRGYWEHYLQRRNQLRVAYLMERRGVSARLDRIDSLITDYTERSILCGNRCVNIAARYDYPLVLPKGPVNKSLTEFASNVLEAPPVVAPKSKTGNPSLNKDAITLYLNTVYDLGSREHVFFKNFAERKKRNTAVDFLRSYKRFGLYEKKDWIRLHCTLNLCGTATLRGSMNNPNGQQVGKDESKCHECEGEGCEDCNFSGYEYRSLRWCLCPQEDKEWWSFDAKNIELRIPGYEANEKDLIALFELGDAPPFYGSEHLLNFSIVYPDVWEAAVKLVGIDKAGPYCKKEYKSTYYQWCKNGDFAIGYGCQRPKADATFRRVGAYDLLKSRFANKEALNQKCIALANEFGYIETIPDKTVDPLRGYPLECRRSAWGSISPTIPLNYHVQGSAMWWMMRAMIRVQAQLDEWSRQGFPCSIVLQVHDELVIEMPRRANPKTNPKMSNLARANVLRKLMEQGGEDFVTRVSTPCGVEYHTDSWASSEVLI